MNRDMYVSIPQPCHENWDAMTPQDKGRFCDSCAKTVIDFSQMSDTQILNYLSQSKGRLCGRFAQDQIERPLVPVIKERKKIWWMAVLMPLTLLLNKANGQKKSTNEKASITKDVILVQSICTKRKPFKSEEIQLLTTIIYGNVKDENGNPLPLTTVTTIDNHSQTTTNEQGNFSLKLISPKPDTKLLISNISYEQKEAVVDLNDTMNIILKENQAMLPEVCVKSTDSYLSGRVGGLVSVVTVARKDTIATKIRKAFHINPFKVYPNPAIRGTVVHFEVKNEGHYSIQLLNANSKMITYTLFDAVKCATTTTLTIRSSIASGMYYIRLVNDDTKQQYTDKIIVQ